VKFEVQYPGRAPHEIELAGPVAVLGRDPSCDVVVNDVKCSRRHAVVERGPDGLSIRDAGSANGVFVNGRRVERKALATGDVVRIGEVTVRVLPETITGTVDMAPAEMLAAIDSALAEANDPPPTGTTADMEPPAARMAVVTQSAPAARGPRSLALTVLASLWAGLLVVCIAGAAASVALLGSAPGAAVCLALGVLAAILAGGLWTRAPWARTLQIVAAAAGRAVCPFTLAALAVLAFLLTAAGREAFDARSASAPPNDGLFAGIFAGTAALGAVASAVALVLLFRPGGPGHQAAAGAREREAAVQLRRVVVAERAYAAGTCPDVYADLATLARPATAIPGYPEQGPVFLAPAEAPPESSAYRFQLTTVGPVAVEQCRTKGYRHFRYEATPLQPGPRHLMVGEDGLVHAAPGRPPTADDPVL
jgi:hypothetical protein